MWLIVLLLILAALLLAVELVLLPGITVAGFMALAADACALWLAYGAGRVTFAVTFGAAVALAGLTVFICLREKTWRVLSLDSNIEGQSQPSPQCQVQVGQCGMTLSRLAPSGKVEIEGKILEAKTLDEFIDPRTEVTVSGFDNFTVVVRRTQQNETSKTV